MSFMARRKVSKRPVSREREKGGGRERKRETGYLSLTAVDFVCDHPSIRAISFVGSDRVGQYIYERGSANGKRVQSNMGAKNHGVILPDANKAHTINQVRETGRLPWR